MPRRSKKLTAEMQFFINVKNCIEYNSLCKKCIHDCKQSHRAIVNHCHKYKKRLSNNSNGGVAKHQPKESKKNEPKRSKGSFFVVE